MSGNVKEICFDGIVDIGKSESLYEEFEKILAEGCDIVVNAGQVERIDTAIIQLIIAAKHSLEALGCQLQWEGKSEALLNTAKLLGVESEMGLM